MTPEQVRTLIEAHVDAVTARLREDPIQTGSVFEGDVTGDPNQYTNVHHDTGVYAAHNYVDTISDVEVTFTIHSVGMTDWEATWRAGRVLAQLLQFKPTIPGRRCFRMEPAGSQPVTLDRDVTPPKHIAVNRFVLRSIPA